MNTIRMAPLGKPKRKIVVVPITEPLRIPAPQPAPVKVPVKT